jgi:hypothetical protein
MRSLIGVLLFAAIVALAWDKSFSERVGEVMPALAAKKQSASPALRATPVSASASESGAWMWDPNRRTALDRPAYNQSRSFTGHIYYVDDYGRKYWLDNRGARRYDD